MLVQMTKVVAYPHNVAGRPLNRLAGLCGDQHSNRWCWWRALTASGCRDACVANGSPEPYHPWVFNVSAELERGVTRPVLSVYRGERWPVRLP